MKPNPVHRLPAPLEAAVQRLKLAAREATERTIESLGLAALAATHAFQRDGLLGAQFELNRKSAVFVLTFNDAFDERVIRELGPRVSTGLTGVGGRDPAPAATSWDALSLVEDREVEAQISAERFGMDFAHACEWELRELDAHVATVLAEAGGERERNPLRPDIVGHAMIRGIEAVSDNADMRKVLSSELSRSLTSLLRNTYAAIVADFRHAGVQPVGLTVRQRLAGGASGAAGHADSQPGDEPGTSSRSALGAGNPLDSRLDARRPEPASAAGLASSAHSGLPGHPGHSSTRGGALLGQVDPALMSLIRRLAFSDGYNDGGYSTTGAGASYAELADAGLRQPPPNLIHVHREELRQASRGSLDHMVIDVISFLFDQILSDAKVPPQMARQLARLQLPVLRAALGDPSFFSSRRHPVRRFVNRIASLGAAFEDFNEEAAKAVLAKVRELVHEVVEGDFDQIELYQRKLVALEAFVAEQASRHLQGQGGAAELLAEKEDELRLRQLYAERLAGDLKDVAAPAFVLDFISRVWSQVMLRAAAQGGPGGALALRLRKVGRELMLSVQPKPTPAHRKVFLAELPKLMQELTEGMNLIGWPDAQRRAFFGQLMPAHAEALKSAAVRQLDLNLMVRQVEGALERPAPSREEVRAAPVRLPVLQDEVVLPTLSAEEAERVGLVDEATFNWNGKVDIEIGAEPEAPPAQNVPAAPGLPALADAAEPTQGRALADNIQIGFAYEMHLDERWQKVRLSHVSPGRSFFIFSHGARHKKTVSLTQRMLVRLCETGRLRAFENATLLERATERARRQLATLSATPPARGTRH